MSYQILICLDGYVMLPVECKEDVINLRIATPIKPSTQEVFKAIIKQHEQAISFKKVKIL